MAKYQESWKIVKSGPLSADSVPQAEKLSEPSMFNHMSKPDYLNSKINFIFSNPKFPKLDFNQQRDSLMPLKSSLDGNMAKEFWSAHPEKKEDLFQTMSKKHSDSSFKWG